MSNLMKRLQEPSSYAAIAVAIAVFFPDIEQWAGLSYITEALVAIAALVGFGMGEKGR